MSAMRQYAPTRSQPIALTPSQEGSVYGLVAVAMALTFVGVFAGMTFAQPLLLSGASFLLFIAEMAIIFTAQWWIRSSPLNIVMFGAFPFLSGLTFTPYALYVLQGYANGASILLNAAVATTCLAGAAALVAKTTHVDLSGFQGALVMGLIGLLVLGVLQIFIPAMQTSGFELFIAGAGVVLFSAFIAFDVQRTEKLLSLGAHPMLLALSLYLDIFNLFLSVVRFMVAFSGNRRD